MTLNSNLKTPRGAVRKSRRKGVLNASAASTARFPALWTRGPRPRSPRGLARCATLPFLGVALATAPCDREDRGGTMTERHSRPCERFPGPGAVLGSADGLCHGTPHTRTVRPFSAPLTGTDTQGQTGAEPEFRARLLRLLLIPLPSLCPSYGLRGLSLVGQPEVTMGRGSGRPGLGLRPRAPRAGPSPTSRSLFQAGNDLLSSPLLSGKACHHLSSRSQLSY